MRFISISKAISPSENKFPRRKKSKEQEEQRDGRSLSQIIQGNPGREHDERVEKPWATAGQPRRPTRTGCAPFATKANKVTKPRAPGVGVPLTVRRFRPFSAAGSTVTTWP